MTPDDRLYRFRQLPPATAVRGRRRTSRSCAAAMRSCVRGRSSSTTCAAP